MRNYQVTTCSSISTTTARAAPSAPPTSTTICAAASGADFTAKDYRTWAGSVYALAALRRLMWRGAPEARRHIVATVKEVAGLLRNTPAVCRRCYIHPAVDQQHSKADRVANLAAGASRGGV